ncbi:MAG: aminotransferase class I/II-fold pyridoxal phosphate-dependent enzyme [Lachnospiraceae bacterium]|jgi:histidinol-phosphate/aromatic aminotransferase/cobyric acid decarboxylase-like protein/GTP:adenosylcobinamide-phosphate guanylyltransferase
MQAIILAAGMGRRLKELTADNTKCMIEVNGVRLINRVLHQLDRLNLTRVVIVVGYQGQKLIDYISTLTDIRTPVVYVENPIYDKTNNIYSLALAKEYLAEQDTLLLESDLIYEDSVLHALVDDPRDTLVLVDKYESWMDGTVVKVGPNDEILEFVPGKNFVFDDIPQYYKTVNLYKFSREFSVNKYIPFLEAYEMALGNNEYYEQVLRVIAMLDDPGIRAKKLSGQRWYEIDDIQDLDIAESLFADDDERLTRVQSRYGGYWRYPKMTDFCYLVNPFFPTKRMKDEMRVNFDTLLTGYPSGMAVNSLLASRNFNVHQNHIAVGNGAAELIKSVMEKYTDGKTGVIRPTFEEYPNRLPEDRIVAAVPETDDFSYTVDDIEKWFFGKVRNIILINPDNPSGQYIPKIDVLRLAADCEREGIRLIYDESFIDFADEKNPTLLDEAVLKAYPHLIDVKSISKSYGVPGARLGILASADEELIASVKKDVSIWNINSFGEFFMQILGKYQKAYAQSLDQIREARRSLSADLKAIRGLKVFPSQANYITVEITDGHTSREVTRRLYIEKNILVKDLTPKMKRAGRQYLRLSVLTREDNRRLTDSLAEILG